MSFTKRTYTAHETIITAENLNDIQDAIIAGEFLSGTGAPNSATVGAVNQLYRDENTGKEYVCIAVNDGVYTWEELNRKPNNYGYEGVDLSQNSQRHSSTRKWRLAISQESISVTISR